MSLYYPLTPVERYCPSCNGFGRIYSDYCGSNLCSQCQGIGRVFVEGGPSFGCKMRLSGRKVGEVVTLGNGDRGRIVRHCKRGEPTTHIVLICPLFDTEAEETTAYPSSTGVLSTLPAGARREDTHGQARSRQDQLDPLQRETRPM